MRKAVLIMSLCYSAMVLAQSLIVSLASQQSGAAGIIVAILWVAGAAFVLELPIVSMWIFVFAGFVAFGGASTGFADLPYWGVLGWVLAGFSWLGRNVRKPKTEEPKASLGTIEGL